jgi:hypothetical protein
MGTDLLKNSIRGAQAQQSKPRYEGCEKKGSQQLEIDLA